ncbi:MAG: Holliday junction DNA helicase RuvB C-terminal domain-containing protein [Planctomycetota bacterium]
MSRPISDWFGFLGQRQLIRALRPIAEGAKANGRALPPILFTGQSGGGKTHLANSLATFFRTTLHVLVGRKDLKLAEIIAFFRLVKAHDVAFVDEIQSLQAELQEVLFGIIDEGKLPAIEGAPGVPAERQNLPPFHLIAASDRSGKLLTPLKRRFALMLQFDAYSTRELDAIARQRATAFGMVLSPQAAKLLARTSRGIPRLVGQRLRLLRDFYGTRPPNEFDLSNVRKFLNSLGVNNDGLTRSDRKYLEVVLEQGDTGVSLRTLAARLEIDGDSVFRDIEPFLMREGLVAIQPRGRVLTTTGAEYARNLKE